jgi:type IV pilus assembly protein PilQ
MRMSPVRILSNSVILISLVIACTGCAQRKLSVKEDSLAGGTPFATIQAIKVSGDASHVEISANKPLTYTSYKLDTPPKAVIDLSQTEPGGVATPIEVNTGNIKRIEVGRHGFGESVFSRIEITFVKDEEFSVTTDPADKGKLLITFAKLPNNEKEVKAEGKIDEKQLKVEDLTASATAGAEVKPVEKQVEGKQAGTLAPVASPPPIKPENSQAKAEAKADAKASGKQQTKTLTAVSVVPDGVEIKVSGGIDKFSAFKLDKPVRLVLDIFGVKNGVSAKSLAIGTHGIGTARLGVSPDKVRIVFDTVKGPLPPYQIVKSENGLTILFNGAVTTTANVPEAKNVTTAAKKPTVKTAKPKISSVEAIDFKAAGEYSQISIKVAGDCNAEKPKKVAGGWTMTIKNCQLPRRLQRMLDTSAFPSPVREITPYQVKVREGYDAKILVKLRNEVPFNFKQEGEVITWDIRNPEPRETQAPPAETVKVPPPSPPAVALKAREVPTFEKELQSADRKKVYTGRKVTLEFSDADVRKIFQLIAEVSNLNFLIADDVSGTISLKLVNVPWDQALDVILATKNLEKRQEGNILYIKQKGKFKSAEQEEAEAKKEREKRMELKTKVFDINFADVGDVAGQFDKLKTERGSISQDKRTNRVIVTDIEDRLEKMGNLLKELDMPEKQVMIEARIVEATSTFTRDLGVQWGIHYQDGSASFLGINNLDTGFGGLVTPPPTSGSSGPGGAIGMSFGKLTSNIQIDLRLSAAATAGLVKIISTPKVVTLNNKAAKISQGQNIPYQTTSAEGTKTEFVSAVLSLEVTPHVTSDGNIGLKIHASNNSAGSGSPPPINTKEATTELQVMNGETTVIGGIYVDSDAETDTGVPFLMDIPLIGWLFKSNNKTKTKTELLIFITPRIVS